MKKKETVKFVHDQLKIKKMRKHAVKKWAFAIRYDPDQYKTQQMCDKACSRTWQNVRFCSWLIQKSKNCDETVDNYPDALEFVPGWFKTQKMCDKAVNTHPFLIKSLPKR